MKFYEWENQFVFIEGQTVTITGVLLLLWMEYLAPGASFQPCFSRIIS